MTLTYSLDQNDFLQHHLFSASKNARVKRQRRNNWLFLSAAFLLSSVILYDNDNNVLFYSLLIIGIITFLFFPLYDSRHYKNYYNNAIADTYKNRFGQVSNLMFTDYTLEINDITGESKINLATFENVTETGDYFFPKLKSGGYLIIPKAKIDNVNELRDALKQICVKFKIDFINDLNWKWK